MKKIELMNTLTRSVNRAGLKLKKHSPEILVVAGVVGAVTSAVMACKASTKLSGVLEETKNQLDEMHDYIEKEGYSEVYTEEDAKKDTTIIYVQTGVKLAKLYTPAVILGCLSIGAILASSNILRKRNIALAAAYTTVEQSFKDYRSRVIERFGKDLDRDLKYNIKAQEVEEVVTNEDGTEQTVKSTVNVIDPNTIDDTSRIWYEGCRGWTKDPEVNLMYLKRLQAWFTDKLRSKGYLFLSEVYEELGFAVTPNSRVIGWIYNEKEPIGDNFVDFGIYDIHDAQKANFVNGYERSILLEFNHDGNIFNKI